MADEDPFHLPLLLDDDFYRNANYRSRYGSNDDEETITVAIRTRGKGSVPLHPSDKMALFSLIWDLCKKNHRSFFLACDLNPEGRVLSLADNDSQETILNSSRVVAFHLKGVRWNWPLDGNAPDYEHVRKVDLEAQPLVDLPYLEDVNLYKSYTSSETILSWLADPNKDLPNFQALNFGFGHDRDALLLLLLLEEPLATKAQRIRFHGHTKVFLDGKSWGKLFVDKLPRFPHLQTLELPAMTQANLQVFLEALLRHKKECSSRFLESLCHLDLDVIGMEKKYHSKTIQVLLRFLRAFPQVDYLGYALEKNSSAIQYALIVNTVGGPRLLPPTHGTQTPSGEESYQSRRRLPLSVWPVVLERAQSRHEWFWRTKVEFGATGLYYLLREGPVLLEDGGPNQRRPKGEPPP